ncbi:MAG: transcription antitermination factor NusB [Proteobacteria bacterium]|nr:transcription antitermination factor NusB [Pseudomonadota bacterium]
MTYAAIHYCEYSKGTTQPFAEHLFTSTLPIQLINGKQLLSQEKPPTDITTSGDAEKPKSTPSSRHQARKMALQAVYQWLMSGGTVRAIERQYVNESPTKNADLDFFHELLFSVVRDHKEYEALINPLLDRPFEQIDAIEKAVLYIGTHELKHNISTPYRVVINEGIELAKKFGATDSHKYVNGILDKLANQLRSTEKSARK